MSNASANIVRSEWETNVPLSLFFGIEMSYLIGEKWQNSGLGQSFFVWIFFPVIWKEKYSFDDGIFV